MEKTDYQTLKRTEKTDHTYIEIQIYSVSLERKIGFPQTFFKNKRI
jgi:hypothetical protein